MMTKSAIRNAINKIRRENPESPIGDHWEGVGVYLGDKMWADPEFVGMPGELELLGL